MLYLETCLEHRHCYHFRCVMSSKLGVPPRLRVAAATAPDIDILSLKARGRKVCVSLRHPTNFSGGSQWAVGNADLAYAN